MDGRVGNYVPDNDTDFLVLIVVSFAEIHVECPDCCTHKFLKSVGRYLHVNGAVDAVLWKIYTKTDGVSKGCYLRTAAVLYAELSDIFRCEVGNSFLNKNLME